MKVFILCGGHGERLKPFTTNNPKPLIDINGRPILAFIIDQLIAHDLTDINLLIGHQSAKFRKFKSSCLNDVKVNLIDSGDVEIIIRLQEAVKDMDEDFLVLYGDTISDIDFKSLLSFNKSGDSPATITVWTYKLDFGIVTFDEKFKVNSFHEKPPLDKWINIGYFYFRKDLIPMFSRFEKFQDLLAHLASSDQMNAYVHRGYHFTVNTINELQYARENLGSLVKQ
jgi:NDP-sugar pyrophosphorylase family protein